jgi:hypothetical protein
VSFWRATIRSFRIRGGEDGPGCDDPGKLLESSEMENKSCCVLSALLEGISTGVERSFPFRSGRDVCWVVIQSAWGDMVRLGLEEVELCWGYEPSDSHSAGFIARRSGGLSES